MTSAPKLDGTVIIGAGGHARVVLDALLAAGESVAGLIDADPKLHGLALRGVKVLGGDDVLAGIPMTTMLVLGIGSVGTSLSRERIVTYLRALGFRFRAVLHPRAITATDVTLGEGAFVAPGAIINTGSRIGSFAIVNTGAIVDHDCRIGDYVHIGPGAALSGGVTIGDGAHIGTGAAVMQGLTVGARAVVGVGAAVIRDVPDGAVVGGAPARPLREPRT